MIDVPQDVAKAWGWEVQSARPMGQGRINDTLLVSGRTGASLVLQRLHPTVFPEPEKVMANVVAVLRHLPPGPLRLVPTQEGQAWWRDAQGHAWRAWEPITPSRTVEGRATPSEALVCARAFGAFLAGLKEIPPATLHVILPRFHDTPHRLAQFWEADEGAQSALDPERERVQRLSSWAGALQGLPLRIAHDDTKLNNVLLHAERDEALAVLDLDTVQPGSWVVDFGDMARSACNPIGEDAPTAVALAPDLITFAALAKGFLQELAPHLTPEERERMSVAPAVLAFELGLRFLTDHVQGDRIFKVRYPGQNLQRAKVQLALAEGFLASQQAMAKLLA